MVYRISVMVLLCCMITVLVGCGGSGGASSVAANGTFYGGTTATAASIVPGLAFMSRPSLAVGLTNSAGGFVFSDGDVITFSINGFALPDIDGASVVSALSFGTPGVLDNFSRNVSILFTMLDTEPGVPGIQLPDTNYSNVRPPGGMTTNAFFSTASESEFIAMAQAMFLNGTYVPSTETYRIGVTVSGLVGTLVLQNNGGDDLSITTNGMHYFATEVSDGLSYNVTVMTRPPGQACTIEFGSGLVMGADITNITATCETAFVVGGTITDFTGSRDYPNMVLILTPNGNSSNAETLTVTASGPFEFSTAMYTGDTYAVTIDTDNVEPDENATVTNGSGTIVAADIANVAVDCPGRVMLHPISIADNISPDGYDVGKLVDGASSTSVDMDNAGNVIIAWTQTDGTNGNIFYSHFDAATSTWSHPPSATTSNSQRISPGDTYAIKPKVGMDNLGNALIVWLQDGGDTITNQVYMSEYKDGVWDHPDNLNDTFNSLSGLEMADLHLAVNDDGTTSYASLAWTQSGVKVGEEADIDVYMISGTKANTVGASWVWGAVQHVDLLNDSYPLPLGVAPNQEEKSPVASIAKVTDIAVNSNGYAVLVWEELASHGDYLARGNPDGVWEEYPLEYTQGIFMATYDPTGGVWAFPVDFTDCISGQYVEAHDPACAISDNGDIVIAWNQHDNSDADIAVFLGAKKEYRGGTWSATTQMGANEMFAPDVAIDTDGNAIIAWAESTTPVFDGNVQIVRFEYRAATGLWSSGSTGVISPASTDSSGPVLAMSDDNRVSSVIVWQQSDGTNRQVYLAEARGSVWDDPDDISDSISPNGTETEVNSEAVAMNVLGDTVIIWSQSDGVNTQLFMSEYR